MEIDNSELKTGCFLAGFKGFPRKIKEKVVDVLKRTKKLGQDDPRRIVHSVKVGFALTLVSLLYYLRPLYYGFGSAGMWAVLTVVVVFEFTVGGTLSRGLNRGFGTILAGALGIGAEYLASLFGDKGQPIVLGCFIFLLAASATFSRFFPHIKKKYDYGVLIFILTFCLVSVSDYRVNEVLAIAHQRLVTIMIGGAACVMISIFVCPVWAGEELQNLIALNIDNLACFLEGFGGEYYQLSQEADSAKLDKSFLQHYKSVLDSKSAEESLVNFAWWEPNHGRFRYRNSLKQYTKIGLLTRECAYHIEALNGYLIYKLQSPTKFRTKVEDPCKKISSESGKALKELASVLKTMTRPSSACQTYLQNCKTVVEDLNAAIKGGLRFAETDLFEILPDIAVALILIDIAKSVDIISESIHELSQQANFKDNTILVQDEKKPQVQCSGKDDCLTHIPENAGNQKVLIDITKSVDIMSESFHELSQQANFKDNTILVQNEKKPQVQRGGKDDCVIHIPENAGNQMVLNNITKLVEKISESFNELSQPANIEDNTALGQDQKPQVQRNNIILKNASNQNELIYCC